MRDGLRPISSVLYLEGLKVRDMNMIQKMYDCVTPDEFAGSGFARPYQVSAWMAMGSDTVNIRTRDGFGWAEDMIKFGVPAVQVEKLSRYASKGITTMDDLIEYLFYVVKA
jgi:hypothetical protein